MMTLIGDVEAAAAACQEVLGHRPAALLTDLDGTISPIADDPAAAFVLPSCRAALASLADRLELVAVVTGRSSAVARSLVGLESVAYLGAHGTEQWTPTGVVVYPQAAPYVDVVERVEPLLRRRLDVPGIILEPKGPALAVHYRRTADPARAREVVLEALAPIAEAEHMAISEGRMVVELRPPPPQGKGRAVFDVAVSHDFAGLVYLGDDLTDVEAFEAVRTWRDQMPRRHGVNVAVWSTEMPPSLAELSDFVLGGVADVDALLRVLAAGKSREMDEQPARAG